jgi:streptogramin lyase
MTVGYLYPIAGLGKKTGNGVPAVDSDLADASAVALDHSGNVLVATTGSFGAGAVRVIAAKSGTFYGQKMIKGDIYALPGLIDASAVAVDAAGNVLFGDDYDYLVRMLAEKSGTYYGVKERAGHVYTIAGNGKSPF